MRIVRSLELCPVEKVETIPVDFRADPDGLWEYEALAEHVGFDPQRGRMSVGALTQPYAGCPEGAAVVTLIAGGVCAVAFVDCTVPDEARACA
jgi:hypothetical protein